MFRNLIPALADSFHLVAPDYPGFGRSAFPPASEFEYSFDSLTRVVERFVDVIGLDRFSIYIQDYGAPIGLTIASTRPERVQAIVTQSGNAYMDGFTPFWEPLFAFATNRTPENEAKVRPLLEPDANVWQCTHGTRDPSSISPDLWTLEDHYRHQPPTLITWGRNDEVFGLAGAEAYKRDLPDAELHLLDTGHFALEEELDFIAERIRDFISRHVV